MLNSPNSSRDILAPLRASFVSALIFCSSLAGATPPVPEIPIAPPRASDPKPANEASKVHVAAVALVGPTAANGRVRAQGHPRTNVPPTATPDIKPVAPPNGQ
jgi:hypothetical protein